jgi:hypothetical protein
MVERTKFRQALATRWDERKLNTYIDYSSCVKEANRAAKHALEAREHGDDAPELLSVMGTAEARRAIAFEGLVLLTDESASEAAACVNECLWALLRCSRNPVSVPAADRRE